MKINKIYTELSSAINLLVPDLLPGKKPLALILLQILKYNSVELYEINNAKLAELINYSVDSISKYVIELVRLNLISYELINNNIRLLKANIPNIQEYFANSKQLIRNQTPSDRRAIVPSDLETERLLKYKVKLQKSIEKLELQKKNLKLQINSLKSKI